MAENKRSFLLYADLIHTVNKLPDKEAGVLMKLILSYVNDENPDIDSYDFVIQIAFEPIKQQLKRDLQKYQNIVERNKINGSKGGRPKKAKKPTGLTGNPKEPRKADSDNDTVNGSDIKKKYVYNQFYDEQLELSEHHKGYEIFIKWIFGDNYLARPLVNILKMREQMDFNQYKLLEVAYLKLKNNKSIEQPKIQELLVELEDWVVKDTKNYKRTLAGMIRTFMKGNTKKIKTW